MRETQRLDKVLVNQGFGSRKEIKELLKKGFIRVDGKIIKDGSNHINPEIQVIEVKDEILKYREFIYIMLNKPQGVISATTDKKQKTVVDILPEKFKDFDLFPIGRLDIDTEGLLIMSNDGQLAHELLSPQKHVSKIYYAKIEGKVTEEDVEAFLEGVVLDDGYKTMPGQLNILKSEDYSEIELTIQEGKFHQVKRMFESVGKLVVFLKRIKMGNLKLDTALNVGESRELTDEEVEILKSSIQFKTINKEKV